MAEEKKTTSKKETNKKEVKEVKAEKRFCTNCGRELREKEICDCKPSSPTSTVVADPVSSYFSGFTTTFKNTIKEPIKTIKEEMKKANLTTAVLNLCLIILSFGIFMVGFLKSSFVALTHLLARMSIVISGYSTEIPSFNEIMSETGSLSFPYFIQFLYAILVYIVFTASIIAITCLTAKILKSKKMTFNKVISLYATSMLPTIGAFLVMAVLGLINNYFMMILALIIGSITVILCFVNYLSVFLDEVNVNGEKKNYTITGMIVVFLVILGIFTNTLGDKIGSNIRKGIETKQTSSSSSKFEF